MGIIESTLTLLGVVKAAETLESGFHPVCGQHTSNRGGDPQALCGRLELGHCLMPNASSTSLVRFGAFGGDLLGMYRTGAAIRAAWCKFGKSRWIRLFTGRRSAKKYLAKEPNLFHSRFDPGRLNSLVKFE